MQGLAPSGDLARPVEWVIVSNVTIYVFVLTCGAMPSMVARLGKPRPSCMGKGPASPCIFASTKEDTVTSGWTPAGRAGLGLAIFATTLGAPSAAAPILRARLDATAPTLPVAVTVDRVAPPGRTGGGMDSELGLPVDVSRGVAPYPSPVPGSGGPAMTPTAPASTPPRGEGEFSGHPFNVPTASGDGGPVAASTGAIPSPPTPPTPPAIPTGRGSAIPPSGSLTDSERPRPSTAVTSGAFVTTGAASGSSATAASTPPSTSPGPAPAPATGTNSQPLSPAPGQVQPTAVPQANSAATSNPTTSVAPPSSSPGATIAAQTLALPLISQTIGGAALPVAGSEGHSDGAVLPPAADSAAVRIAMMAMASATIPLGSPSLASHVDSALDVSSTPRIVTSTPATTEIGLAVPVPAVPDTVVPNPATPVAAFRESIASPLPSAVPETSVLTFAGLLGAGAAARAGFRSVRGSRNPRAVEGADV